MQSIKNPANLAGLSQRWCLWLFCEILEKGKNLRRFLFSVVVIVCVIMPIAFGVGVWIANH